MPKFSFLFVLAVSILANSADRREHKAHQHGAAKMAIAFDGINGKINLELAGDSIYGFEYIAKTANDKKKQQLGLQKLEDNIADMVKMSADLKCVFSKEKIEVQQQNGNKHSDIDAQFAVRCAKDPVGSTVTFNIQKYFPSLKDVDVQILVGDVQKSAEIKANGVLVEIKN